MRGQLKPWPVPVQQEAEWKVMLVLYDTVHSSVWVKYPTRRNRLRARLHANRLDHELANGASPDSTVARALRAQALVRPEVRLRLAGSIERLLAVPLRATGRPPVTSDPAFHRRVHAASDELNELIRYLRTPGPVPAQGVAKVRLLLTDGTGPLHRGSGGLSHAVREAIAALEPNANWA
jgi:hypothetical protein